MPSRPSCFAALAVAASLGFVAALPATHANAAGVPLPPKMLDTWAFCGVSPDDANAPAAARAMAQVAGIDATFGPCNVPVDPYTPVSPSNRYVHPDVYMRLVLLNASVGMKTVVYDDRLWSLDPNVRTEAINYWMPVVANIAAWDLGDEYNPTNTEWDVLKQRWLAVQADAQRRTGVKPFANFRADVTSLNKALTDLPGTSELLSFDQYMGDKGVSLAQAYDSRVTTLMCAVNEIAHNGLMPTPLTIRADMTALQNAGCDRFLVFTGFPVYEDTKGVFSDSSIVDRNGVPTNFAPVTQEGTGHSSLVPIGPIRILETRTGPGLGTVDGGFNGIGILPADSVLQLGIGGRPGLPSWAQSVVLNVTVTGAVGPGYLTVYPCGGARPTSSNLNYDVGTTRAVAVVARVGDNNGAVCIYTQTSAHVIADLVGAYPSGAGFDAVQPARLLDSRIGPEFTTVDGHLAGVGRRLGGVVTEVQVTGRGNVPLDATSVAVNVTAVGPAATGFATVFPCGEAIPLASTVNFTAGAIVPNAAQVKVGANGAVCIYSNVDTDLILDVNGYDSATAVDRFFEPMRVLETRPGLATADQLFQAGGLRPNDSVLELPIGGRLGVPTAIRAAVLNITVTQATGPGFLTVYACGSPRPVASTLNYTVGTTVANLAIAPTSADGKVCIYTQTATHLVVDLSGYHT